ncbi:hypothetical protein HDU76_006317 [Blyttiomyces sp. JEL0837]|nr:hypothetical protein HDU76_006317 [Blyttiomyces sp. JEL0837]
MISWINFSVTLIAGIATTLAAGVVVSVGLQFLIKDHNRSKTLMRFKKRRKAILLALKKAEAECDSILTPWLDELKKSIWGNTSVEEWSVVGDGEDMGSEEKVDGDDKVPTPVKKSSSGIKRKVHLSSKRSGSVSLSSSATTVVGPMSTTERAKTEKKLRELDEMCIRLLEKLDTVRPSDMALDLVPTSISSTSSSYNTTATTISTESESESGNESSKNHQASLKSASSRSSWSAFSFLSSKPTPPPSTSSVSNSVTTKADSGIATPVDSDTEGVKDVKLSQTSPVASATTITESQSPASESQSQSTTTASADNTTSNTDITTSTTSAPPPSSSIEKPSLDLTTLPSPSFYNPLWLLDVDDVDIETRRTIEKTVENAKLKKKGIIRRVQRVTEEVDLLLERLRGVGV